MANLLRGPAVLLLALACFPAAAQTYKCTDARGVTSYSDKPCSGGRGGEVRIPGAQAPAGKAKPREVQPAAEPEKPEHELTHNERAERQLAARLAYCAELKRDLATLEGSAPIPIGSNAKGERTFMGDANRKEMAAKRRGLLQQCQ